MVLGACRAEFHRQRIYYELVGGYAILLSTKHVWQAELSHTSISSWSSYSADSSCLLLHADNTSASVAKSFSSVQQSTHVPHITFQRFITSFVSAYRVQTVCVCGRLPQKGESLFLLMVNLTVLSRYSFCLRLVELFGVMPIRTDYSITLSVVGFYYGEH